jgi:hypothetical protein
MLKTISRLNEWADEAGITEVSYLPQTGLPKPLVH